MKWFLSATVVSLLALSATCESPNSNVVASLSPDLEIWLARVMSLKGEDDRLYRPDASEHTAARQKAGDCDKLADAAKLIVSLSSAVDEETLKLKDLAAEYSGLCMLDNAENRAIFANAIDIHKAVVAMVGTANVWISSTACSLISIATFANEKNHQAFIQQGAVEALAKIIMDHESTVASQKMFAAAALANLAGSYCQQGRCLWEWSNDHENIQLAPESVMISNGAAARSQILSMEGLVDVLSMWACQGPIRLHEDGSDEGIVMVGSTAREGQDEEVSSIITWAAMQSLLHLALDPTSKESIERVLECACFLRDSADWLEVHQGADFLYFMRRSENPCYENHEQHFLCVDGNFFATSNNGTTCDAYENATPEECEAAGVVDQFTGVKPKDACCQCGGGAVFMQMEEGHEEFDQELDQEFEQEM